MLSLNKKASGIRRIAVGLTLRRPASKCASSPVLDRLRSDVAPRQLGLHTILWVSARYSQGPL